MTVQSLSKDSSGMWKCSLKAQVTYVAAGAPAWRITSPVNLAPIGAGTAQSTLKVTKPAGVMAYVTLHKWDPAAANPADPNTPGNWVPIDLGGNPAGSWNIDAIPGTATKIIPRPDTVARTYKMTLFEDTNGDHVSGDPKDTITFTW